MNSLFKLKCHHILGVAAAALLIGCSGGESGTGMQASQTTTTGEITGFGSVYVGGVKFNTDNATIHIDGVSSAESSLSVGMVVTVTGSVNSDGLNGTANAITAKTEVEGLVFANDVATNNTLNVMGQIINISNDTKFKSEITGITSVDQLIANVSVVEVSGYSDGQGNIYATYIKTLDSNEVKLHGVIQNLSGNNDGDTFEIGGITVTFNAAATQFEDVTQVQLANGMYVSVESANYTGEPVLASEVELEDFSETEGSQYELEGIVTDTTNIGSSEFAVNGRLVKFDNETTFIGGDQSSIQLEVKLEVEGKVQADNSILADEISFRTESDMEIEGPVVNIGTNSLEINDPILGTITITVNEFTSYEDEIDEDNRTFYFEDIVLSMNVDVKFYVDSEMGNIATSIKRVEVEP
ncbi:DUF5666 domain-containing protein [Kaarinaea lacus]